MMPCTVEVDITQAEGPFTIRYEDDPEGTEEDWTAELGLLATLGLRDGKPQDPETDTHPFAHLSVPDGIVATINGRWPIPTDLLVELAGAGLIVAVRTGMREAERVAAREQSAESQTGEQPG